MRTNARVLKPAYQTPLGRMYCCPLETFLKSPSAARLKGKVQLIFTSPPFPLNKKKAYGNLQGERYVRWLANFAPRFKELLKPNGSLVIELGNSWQPGRPIMSTLALEALLRLKRVGNLRLAQQFVCYNPARLPSPAQWVNVKRIRVKDSYTHLWWLSLTDHPFADNRNILKPYSESMRQLLKAKKYNAGMRPSEHHIGKRSFLRNNQGAIPSNVLQFSNTVSNGQQYDQYYNYCRAHNVKLHPARMPMGLPEFFIKFLTAKGDLVLDPFAGSNTTGGMAEILHRKWIAIETNENYVRGSKGRFPKSSDSLGQKKSIPKRSKRKV